MDDSQMTVTGKTIRENLKDLPVRKLGAQLLAFTLALTSLLSVISVCLHLSG